MMSCSIYHLQRRDQLQIYTCSHSFVKYQLGREVTKLHTQQFWGDPHCPDLGIRIIGHDEMENGTPVSLKKTDSHACAM
jgi:hypothetical protein